MSTIKKYYKGNGEISMKKNKSIVGFQKSKSVNYSTSVTATKGEKIAIFSVVVVAFAVMVFSFIVANTLVFILSVAFGMLLIFGTMIFCVFRPAHKKERMENAQKVKATVDYSYNNITGKVKDNSYIEIKGNDFSEVVDNRSDEM